MSVDGVSAGYATGAAAQAARVPGKATADAATFAALLNSAVSESCQSPGDAGELASPQAASGFNSIISGYDITNISRNELQEMLGSLYASGQVDLQTVAFGTFDPSLAPGWQDGTSSAHGWISSSNPDQKFNFLAMVTTQAEYNRAEGDPRFQQGYDQMVTFAERVRRAQS